MTRLRTGGKAAAASFRATRLASHSQTASRFAPYEADYRCIELFNMTFFKQVSPVRPMSPELRAVLERVADTQPEALEE